MPHRAQRHESPKAPPSHAPEERESAHARGYSRRWRKARLAWLENHPMCEECLKHKRTTPATEVDHVIPHQGDWERFWDSENWQSLCGTCHKRKTAKERRESSQRRTR